MRFASLDPSLKQSDGTHYSALDYRAGSVEHCSVPIVLKCTISRLPVSSTLCSELRSGQAIDSHHKAAFSQICTISFTTSLSLAWSATETRRSFVSCDAAVMWKCTDPPRQNPSCTSSVFLVIFYHLVNLPICFACNSVVSNCNTCPAVHAMLCTARRIHLLNFPQKYAII